MWDSIGDFLAMGGHAAYVWSAFGMVALVLLIEIALVIRRRHQVQARIHRHARRLASAWNKGESER
ncbi:MAG: heme exporter protein CcmD [Halorhodospira sp.]